MVSAACLQYNTILAHSQLLVPNLRCGQSLGGRWCGGDGVAELREGTSEIMCLKMLLKRGQGRAVANFDRDFSPY